MKKVKEAMKAKGADDEKVTTFEKGAQAYVKKIIGKFSDFEFFVGESMDPDGMFVVSLLLAIVSYFVEVCYANAVVKGCALGLSGGWSHTLCYGLEARVGGD